MAMMPVIVFGQDYEPFLKEDNLSLPVYDLQGRRLSAQPTKGIYIQNGKKMGLRTLPLTHLHGI